MVVGITKPSKLVVGFTGLTKKSVVSIVVEVTNQNSLKGWR